MRKEQLAGEFIFVVHDFLTPEECAAFIVESEQEGYGDAPIMMGGKPILMKDVRNNERVIHDDVPLAAKLFERVRPFLPAQRGKWSLTGLNERFRYYRYDPGQAFAPHYDGSFRRGNGEESLLTFMIYLNDGYKGGNTRFYRDNDQLKVDVAPRQGMALVFDHLQLHEGAPVISGRKYVLRTDVMFRPS